MKIEKDFQNIIKEIILSYEIKVRTVIFLIGQVAQKIQYFHKEQIRMADKLKDILARNQSLRRKDFDIMIADIQNNQAQRENEIALMVKDFCAEEESAVDDLKKIISEKNPFALQDFTVLKEKMLNRPREREKRLSQMLKNFHQEQKELSAALRKLLEKGPEVRIKDFKAMLKAFQIEHQEEVKGLDEVLEEFERVKDEVKNKWKNVMAVVDKGGEHLPLGKW